MNKFEFELNLARNTNHSSRKIFFLTFIIIFLFVALKHLGLEGPIISPIPKPTILDSLLPKLKEKQNFYKLKKQSSFIPLSFAAAPDVGASAYAVIDYDSGTIIAQKSPTKKLPVASLTKLMTAVVALDLASPSQVLGAPPYITKIEPTHLGLKKGEKMTLEELLNASLMTSANDAAEVIRSGINRRYGENLFINAMNKKAEFIGLKNTHFTNPQGFDNEKNYSTVSDLAMLAHYALTNYPFVAQSVVKDYIFLEANSYHNEYKLYNWNGLLDVYPGVFGVKIGNTDDAGNTTIVGAQREGKKILVVLLGAPGILERDLWAAQLLDLGFSTFDLPSINITERQLRIKYSTWK